jgi:hypothetical protein
MEYTDIRPLIDSGDVLAFGHEDWKTKSDLEIQAVRFVTQSEFAHVGTIIRENDRVYLIEAVVPKVRKVPLSEIKGTFYWIPMRKPLSSEATDFALSIVGANYSKLEAVLGFFNANNELNSKWQCAEVTRVISKRNELPLPGRATPTSVVRDCMSLHNPLILVTN